MIKFYILSKKTDCKFKGNLPKCLSSAFFFYILFFMITLHLWSFERLLSFDSSLHHFIIRIDRVQLVYHFLVLSCFIKVTASPKQSLSFIFCCFVAVLHSLHGLIKPAMWREQREKQDGEKIITDWMNLMKWHVCVCSVLLCISVRSAAAAKQLGDPASQSISHRLPASPSLTIFLCLTSSSSASFSF